jgi:uncharacterized protein YjbJ (UPF0337 family)
MICGSSDKPSTVQRAGSQCTVPVASGGLCASQSANRFWFAEQTFQPTVKEMIVAITPNKDQVKGELKDIGGKVQEEAGKLVGSREQQAKGLQKQAEGKLQKGVGDLKEAVTDAVKKA